jgi:DNA-binding NarL/FixJ family response regulator
MRPTVGSRSTDPSVAVHSESILVERGLAAGALGYVVKDAAGDELVAAVQCALGGQTRRKQE